MSVAKYFDPRLRALLLKGFEPNWLRLHPRKRYIVACVLASVPWPGEREKVMALRAESRRMTEATGVEHTLDHIVPLNHPYVCGLHIAHNLRVVPWTVNASKGNNFHPDQLDLLYAE